MSFKFPHHKKGKSRGDGISSYRITSYLSLSKSQAESNPQNIPPPQASLTDILDENKTVATDNHEELPKINYDYAPENYAPQPVQYTSKIQFIIVKSKEIVELVKLQIKLKIEKPLDIAFNYIDMAITGFSKAGEELNQLISMFFKTFINKIDNISNPNVAPLPETVPNQMSYQQQYVSFVDLQQINVEFTDNHNYPLFDFSRYKNQRYPLSSAIVDPIATETALQAIRECAARASSIPPAMEGRYANIPLGQVLANIAEEDLQLFLQYVKVYPGNYVGRCLKISETFATWVVYGAPVP